MTGIVILFIIMLSFIIIRWRIKKLNISPIELKNRLDRNDSVMLIDVRNADEYYGPLGHIQGARLSPLNRIAAWAETVPVNSDSVILICQIGNRSLAAARILSNRGITAYNLQGGMVNWNRHGFPVQHR
jgi:rhodanese-related sulfurtransferase